MGLWNSLLGPLLPDWSVQPKNVPAVSVEDAAVCASVAEQDPMPVLRSSDGRDEPEHLRRKRERVRNAELVREGKVRKQDNEGRTTALRPCSRWAITTSEASV